MRFVMNYIFVFLISSTSLFSACSEYIGDFYINEVHTWSDQVEIYAKVPTAVSNWTLVGCTMEGNGNNKTQVCEPVTFSYSPSIDGYFLVLNFSSIDFHDDALDFLLYDDTGAIVNYFRVGKDLDLYPLQVDEANECEQDNACNIFVQDNSGQRNFQRQPDGSCTWQESTGLPSGSSDTSNDGTLPAYVIFADYRMDECFWNSTPGEVIDSTVFGYHGTGYISSTVDVNVSGGKLCRSGDFTLDANSDYVIMPKEALDGSDQFSFITWLRTDDFSPQTIVSSINLSSQPAFTMELRRFLFIFERIQVTINGAQEDFIFPFLSPNRITGQGWKQLAFTLSGDEGCLYVDGTQIGCHNNPVWDDGIALKDDRFVLGQKINDAGNLSDDFTGYLDEVSVLARGITQTELLDLMNRQNTGINLDGSVRTCQSCPPIFSPKDGNFSAADLIGTGCHAQTNWPNTISTQVINQDINLSILAKDAATDLPMEANITKVSLLYYPSGNNNSCTGVSTQTIDVCTNCGVTDSNGCLNLNVDAVLNNQASPCIEVLIEGKDKDDTAGISLRSSVGQDNFSVRPQTYDCTSITASPLVSQTIYPSLINTIPLSPGYTTSVVALNANTYTRLGDLNTSMSGSFSPTLLSFVNGTSDSNLSFNDVGDVGILIDDSVWANVDSDDTLLEDRQITAECRRLFIPDHFDVVLNQPRMEDNTTFTYLSNDLNMSAWLRDLDVTITARGAANGVMQNYTYPMNRFYANPISLFPSLTLPIAHSSALTGSSLADQNSTDISGFEFVNGVATYSYEDMRFNYTRDFSIPVNPFQIDGNASDFTLNVQDNVYSSVIGSSTTQADGNATFYYGRLNPSDLITTSVPLINTVPIEVYDNIGGPLTSGMTQTGLSWYVNALHISNVSGDITEATASSNTIINSLAGFVFGYGPVNTGRQDLSMLAVGAEEKSIVHLKTQEWLWYVPSGFGSAYDESAGSDCTMHPCFKLTIVPNNTPAVIQSGTYEGADIPDVNRSEYFKKGIKLFR